MTYDDLIAALCVWREARGEPYQVKLAVAAVIVNRCKDLEARWPRVLHRVVLQPYQFSSFNAGDRNAVKFPYDGSGADWLAFEQCQMAVLEASTGKDPTDGANHYFDVSIEAPGWAQNDKLVKTIGRLRFYRL